MLQIFILAEEITHSRSDVIAAILRSFLSLWHHLVSEFLRFFYIIVDISITGKSNMWFNGVISLNKMFSHGKLMPNGLKLNNFAKF